MVRLSSQHRPRPDNMLRHVLQCEVNDDPAAPFFEAQDRPLEQPALRRTGP